MRTPQDILENMEEEINRLRAELNNSKNFHCPHYLTNDSGGVSCHRDFEKEIASLKEQLKREQDCVDFYADKDNWVDMEMIGYSSSIRNDEQCGNEFGESEYLSIGGKLARSAQARREK